MPGSLESRQLRGFGISCHSRSRGGFRSRCLSLRLRGLSRGLGETERRGGEQGSSNQSGRAHSHFSLHLFCGRDATTATRSSERTWRVGYATLLACFASHAGSEGE